MADVTKTAGPNETANQLEEERKNSIRKAFKGSRPVDESSESEKTEETSEKVEKSEEKLDKDEKNSYINKEDGSTKEESSDEGEESTKDEEPSEEEDKYRKIFENQFSKDGIKAAKSWSQAQKEYTKLRQKQQEQEQVLNKFDELLEQNPLLEDFIKTAQQKGNLTKEDLQSFLKEDREPTGKPNTSSEESKLEIVDEELDISKFDDQTLAQAGLLDLSKKDSLTDAEWKVARRQAAIEYAERNLPNKIANKAYKTFKQQIEEEQKRKEQEEQQKKNKQLNNERYRQGIEKVVEKFGLDFAGNEDHRDLLDEIENRASYIRDSENPQVIRPNAIYLATVELIEEGKLDVDEAPDVSKEAEKARNTAEQELEDRAGGFNKSASSTKGGSEPETIAEKLRQRRLDQYKQEMEWRRNKDLISGDKNK